MASALRRAQDQGTKPVDPIDLAERARALPHTEGADLVKDVTCDRAFAWRERAERIGNADHAERLIAQAEKSAVLH